MVQIWYLEKKEVEDGIFYKLCVGFALAAVACCMGFLPMYATSHSKVPIGAVNVFAGAAFIIGGLVQMFREAALDMVAASGDGQGESAFALAGITLCAAFILLQVLDGLLSNRTAASTHQPVSTMENDDELEDLESDTTDSEMTRMTIGNGSNGAENGSEEAGFSMASGSYGERANTESTRCLAFVLLAAISMHVVLEGVGIGAMKRVKLSLIAIVGLHKAIGAAALGSKLMESGLTQGQVGLSIVLFAFLTPLSMFIGALTKTAAPEGSFFPAILTAGAAGTFAYVGIVELLTPELQHAVSPGKIAALLAGFGISALLALADTW